MDEKTNEEKTIYLVTIHLTTLAFITKAKNEKEAKIFVARHLVNNKTTYGNVSNVVMNLNNFIPIKLSSAIEYIENAPAEGYVSNIARMISDIDNTDNFGRF